VAQVPEYLYPHREYRYVTVVAAGQPGEGRMCAREGVLVLARPRSQPPCQHLGSGRHGERSELVSERSHGEKVVSLGTDPRRTSRAYDEPLSAPDCGQGLAQRCHSMGVCPCPIPTTRPRGQDR
jgi:hypothetical protein